MTTTGLRERKKLRTRAALRAAALRLTAERGLDRVTVEDIAEAADVSPRTFFNYFSSKEEAVIGVDADGMSEIVATLAARPLDEEPLSSLHAVLRAIATALGAAREVHVLRMKVLADNPHLLPGHVAAFVEFERVLVEAVRARQTDHQLSEADSTLVVAAAVAALRVSVDLWLARDDTDLVDLLDRAINQLARGLVSPHARPAVSPAVAPTTKKDL